MFDDKMFIKTGYSGQDLQRAIVKHGIYKQRMDEAKQLEEQQQNQMMEAFQKYMAKAQAEPGEEEKEEEDENTIDV